jgi:alanyl-tRNA synthetase
MLTVKDIRKSFLEYFKDNGHKVVASSPLVPKDDPTLLFTNAGMVQFKNVFLGQDKRDYVRATTVQRCVRAGGKHNDLEKVGYTSRHHTFFEMLGNFSFGDYFKRDAIKFAWEYLNGVLKIPADRMWVTVFKDDDEAADIWLKEVGVDPNRFSRMGEKDNFWAMGDTGPCGPCSEIFYDHGPDVPGGPPGSADADLDRFVEIWNLVFMQFNRAPDGKLTPLPKPSVDTGMGLERVAAVMQSVHSNYEIDLFRNLLKAASKITGEKNIESKSLRVIADHIRSSGFLIADGVLPSNEGRGYVLRRIIRRALRHGRKLGAPEIFFHKLVDSLIKEMGEAYPELAKAKANVEAAILREEEQFGRTLDNGLRILEKAMEDAKNKIIPGDVAFRLYDTYGFPLDLTQDIVREQNMTVDEAGFEEEMKKQRERGKASWKGGEAAFDKMVDDIVKKAGDTKFLGYEFETADTEISVLGKDGGIILKLSQNDKGALVAKATSFYGETGGQVGDTGRIVSGRGVFRVDDTKRFGKTIVHFGEVIGGEFTIGDKIKTEIDATRRNLIRANHTATHLLQAALRQTIGKHVEQAGSLVEPDRFRFDFSHSNPLSDGEISQVEKIVNEKIWEAHTVTTVIMPVDKAIAKGAMAVFDEKYEDMVRVVSVPDFSMELCGGTHVDNTGKIGVFKILKEGSPGAGVRRIEAVTLKGVFEKFSRQSEIISNIIKDMNITAEDLPKKFADIQDRNNKLEKELKKLKSANLSSNVDSLLSEAIAVNGVKIVSAEFDDLTADDLKNLSDLVRGKDPASVTCFGSKADGKVVLLFAATKQAVEKGIDCGNMVKAASKIVGGGGGGKKDMAQAGGKSPDALPKALEEAVSIAKKAVGGN